MKINEFKINDVTFFTVKNDKHLEITFSSLGASIYSIKYKNKYITYHPESKEEFLKSTKYYGKTLGRVCGRLKDGVIEINGKKYNLEINENSNTLHGGINNISFKNFNYSISENDELIYVVFKYKSIDLEAGFPGNVNFVIVYTLLKDKNKFLVHYVASTDTLTPINMSTHIYWRLGGNDVLNHELYISASEKVKSNKVNLLNLGKERVNNLFDFRVAKKIKKDIYDVAKLETVANGYDHGFVFDEGNDGPKIILKNENLMLKVKTDMSMVNIYTNCHPSNSEMKQYGKDVIYGGIAIEPQMYFSSYKDILIDKDNPFDHYFSFELEEK